MELRGLTEAEVTESRARHGNNSLTQIMPEPLWKKVLQGFKDPMIMILLAALVIQAVLYLLGQAEWYEAAGVLIAILLANGVAAVSESQQEGKALSLREEEAAKDVTKVLREGSLQEIPVNDVVTGDIVFLQAGDRIPADGELVRGKVKIDQSVLNGETEEITKKPVPEGEAAVYDRLDLLNPHYVYRGTVVCSGETYLAIKVVGDATLFGQLALEAQSNTRKTPLQVKLGRLAQQISTFGYVGAVAIVLGILLKTFVTGELPEGLFQWIRLIMDAVTVAVTVIVCAVPEGLPMLTSMLLSAQSLKMEKDNVLVKKINGMETSGSLSILFSDKTGTITEGKLSVAELAAGDGSVLYRACDDGSLSESSCAVQDLQGISKEYLRHLLLGLGLNNSASASGGRVIGGNSTDRAIMSFLAEQGLSGRIDKQQAADCRYFNSHDKYAAVEIKGTELTYVKGAPEVLMNCCHSYYDAQGSLQPLPTLNRLQVYANEQAKRSMRLLAVAAGRTKRSEAGELVLPEEMVLVGIISIRDNLRQEAVSAIEEVRKAGIQVVMVTGDKRETAMAIAREAGLLQEAGELVLTSSDMKCLTDDELKERLPRLRVVARALPTDKSRLVRLAQELDYVVGMTGDGVNDSPALKKADVGFAMGSGTEVAKEAGDITILDDRFSSIEKAILYGRSMFKSIRKFLIFQLTVNVAAVLICFIGPLLGENVVLTVIQLLLVNLAMDTLAAIAFGGEPALKEYMQEAPVPRRESIVTGKMLGQVLVCSLYITAICLGILFLPAVHQFFGDVDMTYMKSAVFATFMMAIAFNGFNARTESVNVLQHIGKNKTFLLVTLLIFAGQFLFVELGGQVLSVEPLTLKTWLCCGVLAALVIPVDMVRKLLL
ncbi:MAG: calcium-translocating P-type ATPase, PMCA-type [Selenomonadaceae bacterium]|nr:calcium-translocating P-type ATPase, PMCA-type [Selenomonadaceae bacterium]